MKKEDRIKRFIKWYFNSDRTEKSYKENNLENYCQCSLNACLDNLKVDLDWIKAAKDYLNKTKESKMLDIYFEMEKKALNGDIKSAEWCQKFFKSDFLIDKTDELDDYLSNIDIPALNGGE